MASRFSLPRNHQKEFAMSSTTRELGYVVRRQAAVVEFFRADPVEGFKWSPKPEEALRFVRAIDAQSVASMVADDCEAAEFDAEGSVIDDLPCDAAAGLLGGPVSYGDAVAALTSRDPAAYLARRPGFADYSVGYFGAGPLRRIPDAALNGGPEDTHAYPEFVPSPEDMAASDWTLTAVAAGGAQ